MPFSGVTHVTAGKTTAPFQRSTAMAAPDSFCFSVADKDRSLDLQAQSEQERNQV